VQILVPRDQRCGQATPGDASVRLPIHEVTLSRPLADDPVASTVTKCSACLFRISAKEFLALLLCDDHRSARFIRGRC